MMIEHEDFRSHIFSLIQDQGFQREVAQIQAKALLSEITEQIPAYKWTYVANRVIRNIGMATFELKSMALESPNEIDQFSNAARKFALIWESLAKLREASSRETALLNAAVNYEIAGYQANAACISKQLSLNSLQGEKPLLIRMGALFLQRRFLQLLTLANDVQVEPSVQGELDIPLLETIALALAGKAFSQAVQFFQQGKSQSLDEATEIFEHSEKLFANLSLVEESNLVQIIKCLLPVMKSRSTWTLLSDFAPNQSRWMRYLKLLARGLDANVYEARSVSELWPSQITALQMGLLSSSSNKIVKMPTSAGKTRIAELTIVHTLVNNPGAKCIYVAPYRALVSELEQTFLNLLSDLGYRVSSITGTYESDDFEELLFRETDVLVTTPEKLDLLLRAQPDFLNNVYLFILDEAQMVQDPRRGLKFELLLTRLRKKLPLARFLVISAVVPQQTLEDFAKWFNASPQNDILTSTWRPSVQRYAYFEFQGQIGVIHYAPEEDVQVLREFVPDVITQQTFRYINPSTRRYNTQIFPRSDSKSEIAAELAYKFVELGPVLIFCSEPRFVESVAKALQARIDLSLRTHQTLPEYFSKIKETRSSLLALEWLGDRPMTSWLRSGIGVHYGDLPEAIRKAVEIDFRQKYLRVLIATNTLAQGVNLPVKTVIVHSSSRYSGNTSERIPARDYWNIAGRAGRAGEETEGLIIHITTNPSDKNDFNYYLRRREDVEPVESALYKKLLDLLNNRLSEEGFKAELDAEVLALMAEEGSSLEVIHDVVERSLANIQATRKHFSIEQLTEVLINTADSVSQQINDPELIRLYSTTGLSSNSCQKIYDHIITNEDTVRELLMRANGKRLEELIELFLPVCIELSEIHPQKNFDANYSTLLMRWIEGTEIQTLMSEFSNNANYSDLGKFIDDFFRYRLPWGISAYVRIAKKLLDIDSIMLSDIATFFPSMVKFGLPNPIACWAMSVGIPFRQTAIKVADVFYNETSTPAYRTFLEWLSKLSSERLQDEFDLSDVMFEDVSRAIFISGVNPLLRQFTNLEALLPYEIEVQGIFFKNRYPVAKDAQEGMQVELVRNYDNPVDRNAITIHLSNQDMGYVPHELAQILAPEIDTGTNFKATISNIARISSLRIYVSIDFDAIPNIV